MSCLMSLEPPMVISDFAACFATCGHGSFSATTRASVASLESKAERSEAACLRCCFPGSLSSSMSFAMASSFVFSTIQFLGCCLQCAKGWSPLPRFPKSSEVQRSDIKHCSYQDRSRCVNSSIRGVYVGYRRMDCSLKGCRISYRFGLQ